MYLWKDPRKEKGFFDGCSKGFLEVLLFEGAVTAKACVAWRKNALHSQCESCPSFASTSFIVKSTIR